MSAYGAFTNELMPFHGWKAEVDRIVSNMLGGLTTDDLPDMPYRDEYDSGTTVADMARLAINGGR